MGMSGGVSLRHASHIISRLTTCLARIKPTTDSMIYVWHKDSSEPLEVLSGHRNGSVNDVSWNPASSGMFASAGGESDAEGGAPESGVKGLATL